MATEAESELERRLRRVRPDLSDRALLAVQRLRDAGVSVCSCVPRSPAMLIDSEHVLRCPDCRGLEPGQVDTALGGVEEWQAVRRTAGYSRPDGSEPE
jgi:hypothetical protein